MRLNDYLFADQEQVLIIVANAIATEVIAEFSLDIVENVQDIFTILQGESADIVRKLKWNGFKKVVI